jgi:hypothetical protein
MQADFNARMGELDAEIRDLRRKFRKGLPVAAALFLVAAGVWLLQGR